MTYTCVPLLQWSVYRCSRNSADQYRLIGWYRRSYISSALVSFDSSAHIFMCERSKYFIPSESAGTNFSALFNFNLWLEGQRFDQVQEVTDDFSDY